MKHFLLHCLLLCFVNVVCMAQKRNITGKVSTFDTNTGIPGVSVFVKGTTQGTVTDTEGNYRISVEEKSTLVFSFIGYTTEEIPITNQTVLDIVLLPDISTLSEVVVVGYGTQERADITGAIASIKRKDLVNVPVAGVDALLQGRVAGVQVVQSAGAPGTEVFVRVRGASTLIAENRPLYVIDGVPVNNIFRDVLHTGGHRTTASTDLNPNDIESIEVLKDASALAVYGARASNGVVLVTTRRGSKDKFSINFDTYTGVQRVARKLNLLNNQQYTELIADARANAGLEADPAIVANPKVNTNWQDEVFQSAPISSYNFSASGGSDKTHTYVSVGYFNQHGTVIGQNYKRLNGRLNLDYQATERFKIGTSLSLSRAATNRTFTDYSDFSALSTALIKNPNIQPYNADGTYSVDATGVKNPIEIANDISFTSLQTRAIGNVYAEYNLIKGLTLRTNWGTDFLTDNQHLFIPTPVGNEARAATVQYGELLWVGENTITYQKSFLEKHTITALAGFSLQENRQDYLQINGSYTDNNITRTTEALYNYGIEDKISKWGILSYYGRANYDYANKYLLTATIRSDGSSRFGADKRFGTFPSASIGWRLSEEKFLKNVKLISDLKVRASMGLTGNQEGLGSDYISQAQYQGGHGYLVGMPGIIAVLPARPDLSWESTKQTNVGLDVTVLNGRISLMADAYLKETDKLLIKRYMDTPFTAGFPDGILNRENSGRLQNKGLEFVLSSKNLTGKFKWNTDFNIAFNRNKVTYLPAPESGGKSLDFVEYFYLYGNNNFNNIDVPVNIFRVGQPSGAFYGYRWLGVNAETGDPMYQDINGDGQINEEDLQIIGSPLPLHTGGIANNFSYKGFELNVFMQWSYGNKVYNQTKAILEGMNNGYNSTTTALRRWRKPGDQTDVPKAVWIDGYSGEYNRFSSRWVEDGSFLRVKNVTLAYNLPANLLKHAKIHSVRVYTMAQNLHTFTRYSGFDPEVQNQQGRNAALGVDYLTQPQSRTFIVGVNVGF